MALSVLKLRCEGDVYRVQLASGERPSLENVKAAVTKVGLAVDSYSFRYRDESGDLCTLCQETFADFLEVCEERAAVGAVQKLYEVILVPCTAPEAEEAPKDADARADSKPFDQQPPRSFWQRLQTEAQALWSHRLQPYVQSNGRRQERRCRRVEKWAVDSQPAAAGLEWRLEHPKKLARFLARLRADGLLTPDVVASLVCHHLPHLPGLVARRERKLDITWAAHRKGVVVAAVTAVLQELCEATEGLEPVAEVLAVPMAPGSQLLQLLLTELAALPWDRQVVFVKSLFSSLEPLLMPLLVKLFKRRGRCDASATEHHGVVCGGCEMSPLHGPRFRCTCCADYDLCAACYCKHRVVHVGDCAEHAFACLPVSWNCWQGEPSAVAPVPSPGGAGASAAAAALPEVPREEDALGFEQLLHQAMLTPEILTPEECWVCAEAAVTMPTAAGAAKERELAACTVEVSAAAAQGAAEPPPRPFAAQVAGEAEGAAAPAGKHHQDLGQAEEDGQSAWTVV